MHTHITAAGRTNQANNRQPWEECVRTHITAAGRTSQQLPAAGGVHAHSRHCDWQDKPTIQGCQPREECMRTHITTADRMSQQLPAAGGVHAHSRHRDWQDKPTIQGCQPREECMHTHITAADRTSQQLPAVGRVHAHSHHRGWQEERTVASNERSACALASPLLAEKTNLKKKMVSVVSKTNKWHHKRLPATGGVHAHSHHRCWQRKQT